MTVKKITTTLAMCLIALTVVGQSTHKGLPLLKAHSALADYRIGSDWKKYSWRISPQIESDSLVVSCHTPIEQFVFYSDRDSIRLELIPERIHQFYISLNDTAHALTVVKGVKPNYSARCFDSKSTKEELKFWYDQNSDTEYLKLLRSKFPIDSLVKDSEKLGKY